MAVNHLDALAAELIETGIFTNSTQDEPGKWSGVIDTSRVFNHDETPQFINYGINGTASGLVFAGRGDRCQQMVNENRECVTILPFVSLAGHVVSCQVIFKGPSIMSAMVPEVAVNAIPHLLISTSENGVPVHVSLLAAYEEFNSYLTQNNVR